MLEEKSHEEKVENDQDLEYDENEQILENHHSKKYNFTKEVTYTVFLDERARATNHENVPLLRNSQFYICWIAEMLKFSKLFFLCAASGFSEISAEIWYCLPRNSAL